MHVTIMYIETVKVHIVLFSCIYRTKSHVFMFKCTCLQGPGLQYKLKLLPYYRPLHFHSIFSSLDTCNPQNDKYNCE